MNLEIILSYRVRAVGDGMPAGRVALGRLPNGHYLYLSRPDGGRWAVVDGSDADWRPLPDEILRRYTDALTRPLT